MMDDRAAKLRRLNSFRRRLPHCSANALASILNDIKANGMPEGGTSRGVFKDARNLQNATHTPFGKILQSISVIDKDDAEQQLTIAHPIALLWVASSECSSFSMFFLAKLKETPPSIDKPWRLVAYTDEVTPGNPLAQKSNRKLQAFYWSFLEFGLSALSREEAWFSTAITEYSVHVSGLSAGLSQVVGSIFKLFFSEGINLAVTGVLLHFDGHTPVRLWAVLGGMLQDGGAHKAVWHSRGDSASKFCILCKNLFDQESEIADADGTNLLSCNCLTWRELVPATSNNLRNNARFLERQASIAQTDEFRDMQQALGMTHHKHGILLDRSLDEFVDPVGVYQHDWMHAIFVDGVFNLCLYLILEEKYINNNKKINK